MTKKLFLALLAPALMGGLMACNKQANTDLDPEAQSTGDTYMSVTFSTANPNSTRATVKEDPNFNSIGEYIGRDEIKNVNVYVINLPEETVDVKKFSNTTQNAIVTNPDSKDDTNDFRTEAWKTTAGNKLVYVYVNIAGTEIEKALDKATSKKAFEDANEQAYTLTDANGVMSSYAKYDDANQKDIISMNTVAPYELTVEPGVKKEDAEKNDGSAKNRAKLSVRRLVGQAAVTSKEAEYTITENHGGAEKTLAKLSDLKWDVMQYELTTYLMPTPTENGKDAKMAEFCKSPWWSQTVDDASYVAGKIGKKYFYSAFNGVEVKRFTRNTTDNKENVKAIVATPMKFITETTHQLGGKLEDAADPKTGYRKGNTTYVIVSAMITPDDAAWATGQKDKYTANSDLYFGVQDHKFYAEEAAAKTANKPTTATLEGGKDNVIKYAKGICYYVAWLNPNKATEPVVSPVLRNNIYHVNINAIKKLGYSGNPFDPTNKTPKDPDDKTPDPKETLYPVDTYMAVEINVVNWGVHSYDQEF